jgi:hypothetical protein
MAVQAGCGQVDFLLEVFMNLKPSLNALLNSRPGKDERYMAMNRIFRRFCIIRVSRGPLHYLTSRSDFGFEFAEILVIKNLLPD